MVVQYSASNIAAVSELVDIPSTSLKRRRYSETNIHAKSQIDLAERVSREHYVDGRGSLPIQSVATFTAKSKVLRRVSADIVAKTELKLASLLVLPLPVKPSGKVILNGTELNKQRIKSGLMHNLIFEVHGSKIAGMQLEFTIRKINGDIEGYKTLTGTPGGIYEESITETSSEKIHIGTIPLLGNEFKLESGEEEFTYSLIQSNDFLNLKYEITSGMFSVY